MFLFYRPPGSPTKDSVFKRAKAEYSFNGKNPKELSVHQGDELMVRFVWESPKAEGATGSVL